MPLSINILYTIFSIFVCMFIILIGLVQIIVYFSIGHKVRIKFFLYFGIFAALSGFWSLTQASYLQFININIDFIDSLRNSILVLMPVPFLLFLLSVFNLKSKKILKLLCWAHIVVFISSLISEIVFKANSILQFDTSLILIIITTLTVMCINLAEGNYARRRKLNSLDMGSLVMCSGAIISIVSYYGEIVSDYSLFFRFGLLIYCGLLSRFYIIYLSKMYEKNARIQLLEQMAYTDMASGFYNFNRFDEDMKGRFLQINAPYNYSVALINLNNLQLISQIKGRKEAQEQSEKLINCIKESFKNCKDIYRIGNDEFVVICQYENKQDAQKYIQTLEDAISLQNEDRVTKISVCYAMLNYDEFSDKSLEDLYLRTETAMFKHKIKTKRKFDNLQKQDTENALNTAN